MKWKIALTAAAVVVVVAGGVVGLRVAFAPGDGPDVFGDARVHQAFEKHSAELRAIPGVTMLGTYESSNAPARIVVYVNQVTPEIEAAVPDEIDGFVVEIREPLPSPPGLSGVVKAIAPASPEQSAEGLVGTLTIEGKLRVETHGSVASSRRTLVVNVPSDLKIWRPMGEGKEFIEFTDIRTGDSCWVVLKAVPVGQQRQVTAEDLEVMDRL
jgi:hypothetical protein